MLPFEVTILGNSSAIPAHGRHPSAQLINVHSHYYFVDCGEGTQERLIETKKKPFKVNHIFISHLHGDHFFGLIGLLTSMNLLGRVKPVTIYAHRGLQEIINTQLKYTQAELRYSVHYFYLPETGTAKLLETNNVEVTAFPLTHRIACHGFLFKEKHAPKKLNMEKIQAHNILVKEYKNIQAGKDVTLTNGKIIRNETLTIPQKTRSYAYCTDTQFTYDFVPHIKYADMAYIDCTYGERDAQKAFERYHCTATQAAKIADKAAVKNLLLGHFSSKHKHLNDLLNEAKQVFSNVKIAEEGCTFNV